MFRLYFDPVKVFKRQVLDIQPKRGLDDFEQRLITLRDRRFPSQPEAGCRFADLVHALALDLDEESVGQFIEHDMAFVELVDFAVLVVSHELLIPKCLEELFRLREILHGKLDLGAA